MATRLFVGSLSWGTTSDSLRAFFSKAGQVVSADVISDRMTGRSKGFGFVEMASDADVAEALKLNGQTLDGRAIIVNEARPQEDRPRFGGGGNRGGFGGGNRRPDNRGGDNRRGGSSFGGSRGNRDRRPSWH